MSMTSELMEKRLAKFSIEFFQIENLQDGCEMFLQWGSGAGNRSRTVLVKNGCADFTGEAFNREVTMQRDKKYRVYYKTVGLSIKLRQVLHSKAKRTGTVAIMNIDLSRFLNSYQCDVTRPFDLWSNSIFIKRGVLLPMARFRITCSWNEPQNGGLQPPEIEKMQTVVVSDAPEVIQQAQEEKGIEEKDKSDQQTNRNHHGWFSHRIQAKKMKKTVENAERNERPATQVEA